MRPTALLALEDGSLFRGSAIGASGSTAGEVIFDTALTGYQEALTDPACQQQLLALTYPHIGNAGTNSADAESARVQAAGLIVREVPRASSNWRSTTDLCTYLEDNGIVAIADVDTRRLTRLLRDKGPLKGCILAGDVNAEAALERARASDGLEHIDLASAAGTSEQYDWTPADGSGTDDAQSVRGRVAVYDFGVGNSCLRLLADCGFKVTVVPAATSVGDVLALPVDGVVLSNGPGDPAACESAVATCRQLLERHVPLFGFGLGHQLIGLATGAQRLKMRHGHHGANHPVQNITDGKVMITRQNNSFVLDETSLPDGVRTTHRSLFDGAMRGMELVDRPVSSFQGHPEASMAGPLLARFTQAAVAWR